MRRNALWWRLTGPGMFLGLGSLAALLLLTQEPASDERVLVWPYRPHHCGVVAQLVFSSDGATLTAVGSTGAVARWDVDTGRAEALPPSVPGFVTGHAFTHDGMTQAAIDWNENLVLRRLERGAAPLFRPGYGIALFTLAFSPDARTLAAGGQDGVVVISDVPYKHNHNYVIEHAPVLLQGPASDVVCVAFSPDGSMLAAGDRTGKVTLWDTATRTIKAIVGNDAGHTASVGWSRVRAVAFSPDSTELAMVRYLDDMVRLFDVASGRQRRALHTQGHPFFSLAYAPRDGLIVAGAGDGTITLWDAATGQVRGSRRGHQWQVSALAFSPDGRVLASADGDANLRLWEIDRGKRTFTDHFKS